MLPENSSVKAILFDLDGTITDSYAGLQHAFDYAYAQVYGKPSTYNIRPLVGPPMRQIFRQLTGEQDEERTAEFIRLFQARYDAESYRMCELFAGMDDLLRQLQQAGIKLYIATNKRKAPTESVLEHLDIRKYFRAVYSVDSVQPPYADKALMVKDILARERLNAGETLFIGDTLHDRHGADENGLKFIYAEYGFGDLGDIAFSIKHAAELWNHL